MTLPRLSVDGISRATELERWDMPMPPELDALVRAADEGNLQLGHDYVPFATDTLIFGDAETTFDDYVHDAQRDAIGFALFVARMSALHPVGLTARGDLWFVGVLEPEVYLFERATRSLRRTALTVDDLRAGRTPLAPRPRVRLPAASDPVNLWKRATWLADFLGAHGDARWEASIDDAPPLKLFVSDHRAGASRPDLLAYWILAHWLLGNGVELDKALAASARSTNGFVRCVAAAVVATGPVRSASLRFGALDETVVDARIEALGARAPSRTRNVVPVRDPRARMTTGAARLAEARASGADLVALMREHVADLELQWMALDVLASADEDLAQQLAFMRDYILTKRGPELAPLFPQAVTDSRFVPLLLALLHRPRVENDHFARSLGASFLSDQLVAKLATMNDALARSALVEMALGSRAGWTWARLRDVLGAVADVEDPRLDAMFENTARQLFTLERLAQRHRFQAQDECEALVLARVRRHEPTLARELALIVRKAAAGALFGHDQALLAAARAAEAA